MMLATPQQGDKLSQLKNPKAIMCAYGPLFSTLSMVKIYY